MVLRNNMRLRNFFGGCRPCCYDLLTYHSLVFEVLFNIGELCIYSMNLDYLNSEFTELRISFNKGNSLMCSEIYDYESQINITFTDYTTEEELEKFITNKIIDRYTMSDGIICARRLDSLEYVSNYKQHKI